MEKPDEDVGQQPPEPPGKPTAALALPLLSQQVEAAALARKEGQEFSDDSDLDSAVEQEDEVWFVQNGPWGKVYLAKPDPAGPGFVWQPFWGQAQSLLQVKRDGDGSPQPFPSWPCLSSGSLTPQVLCYRSSPQLHVPFDLQLLMHALWSSASLSGSSAFLLLRYGSGSSRALSRPVRGAPRLPCP